MARDKLNPEIERKRHFHAFEVYRDLGYGRTYRETARQVGATATSVCKWAKLYNWEKRIIEYGAVVAKKRAEGAIIKVDNPIAKKVVDAMEKMEAIIDSVFVRDTTGKLSPKIKVKSMDELTKFVSVYRQFLETYHRFVAEYQPARKEKDRGTTIDEFNVFMGNVSQEERIAVMKGLTHGNEPRGNKQPAGRVQNADFTEVPERGDEDGHGCDGVSDGVAGSDSRNKETLRKS